MPPKRKVAVAVEEVETQLTDNEKSTFKAFLKDVKKGVDDLFFTEEHYSKRTKLAETQFVDIEEKGKSPERIALLRQEMEEGYANMKKQIEDAEEERRNSEIETQLVTSPSFEFHGDSSLEKSESEGSIGCNEHCALLPCKPWGPPPIERKLYKSFDDSNRPEPAIIDWPKDSKLVYAPCAHRVERNKDEIKRDAMQKLFMLSETHGKFKREVLDEEEARLIRDLLRIKDPRVYDEDSIQLDAILKRTISDLSEQYQSFSDAFDKTGPFGAHSLQHKNAKARVISALSYASAHVEMAKLTLYKELHEELI
jgi:hypothetical protein